MLHMGTANKAPTSRSPVTVHWSLSEVQALVTSTQ
jgi:hypothetical protein